MDLYNDHNLYILGAGFSNEANMPLMSTFMSELKKAYNWYPKDSHARSSIRAILNFRQLSTSSAYRINLDLDNIEDLFSLAATEGEEGIKLLRTGLCATLKYCKETATYNPFYEITAKDDIPYLKIDKSKLSDSTGGIYTTKVYCYDYIASILGGANKEKNKVNSIISFNYDTVLEESFNSIGVDYGYYIDEEIEKVDNLNNIPVIKMHGSMNWEDSGEKITLKSFDKILEEVRTPYIIPPIWTKSSNHVTNKLWKNALKLISSATRIIIIGFSLPRTDLFFRYLLASGLKDNISLERIFIVNPNYSDLENDIDDMFSNNKTKDLINPIILNTTRAFHGYDLIRKIGRSADKRIEGFYG